MSYKTLLVHLDDSRHSEARAAFALDLALKHTAHVIGLYVVCQDLLRPLVRRDDSLNLGKLEAQEAERMNRVREQFTAGHQSSCRLRRGTNRLSREADTDNAACRRLKFHLQRPQRLRQIRVLRLVRYAT